MSQMNEASDNLSRIREILVGNELSSLDEKIGLAKQSLMGELALSIGEMKDQMEKSNLRLEQLFEALTQQIATDKQLQLERFQKLEDFQTALGKKIEEQQSILSAHFDQLYTQLDEKLKQTSSELQHENKQTQTQLLNKTELLKQTKVDKTEIASLFENLANSLRNSIASDSDSANSLTY